MPSQFEYLGDHPDVLEKYEQMRQDLVERATSSPRALNVSAEMDKINAMEDAEMAQRQSRNQQPDYSALCSYEQNDDNYDAPMSTADGSYSKTAGITSDEFGGQSAGDEDELTEDAASMPVGSPVVCTMPAPASLPKPAVAPGKADPLMVNSGAPDMLAKYSALKAAAFWEGEHGAQPRSTYMSNEQKAVLAAGLLGPAVIGAGIGGLVNGRKGAIRGAGAGLGVSAGGGIANALSGDLSPGPAAALTTGGNIGGGFLGYHIAKKMTPDESPEEAEKKKKRDAGVEQDKYAALQKLALFGFGEAEETTTPPALDPPTAVGASAALPQVAPRKRTYVGKNSLLSQEQVDKLIRGYEKNTGVDFDKAPVLVNKTQILRNIGRYYVPKTWRQVPSRAWHAAKIPLSLAAGAATASPLFPILEILNATGHPEIGKGDYYMHGQGTVNVHKGNPAVLAHELGHWADYEANASPYGRKMLGFGKYDDPVGQAIPMSNEIAATVFARKAMGEKDWKKQRNQLLPALGTYQLYNRHMNAGRSLGEWWRDDEYKHSKNWKKELQTAMASGDPKAINWAYRQALHNVWKGKNPPEQMKTILDHDEDKGTFAWAKKAPKGIKELTQMLIDSEYKRLYGKQKKASACTGSSDTLQEPIGHKYAPKNLSGYSALLSNKRG